MKPIDRQRGANVRQNLRRWKKALLAMMAGWGLISIATCAGAIAYAHAHHLSQRRTQALAQACGIILSGLLIAAWLTVLVMADRKKSQ